MFFLQGDYFILSHIENVNYTWLLILSPVRDQGQPNTDQTQTTY